MIVKQNNIPRAKVGFYNSTRRWAWCEIKSQEKSPEGTIRATNYGPHHFDYPSFEEALEAAVKFIDENGDKNAVC